jgi:hypothetical protein
MGDHGQTGAEGRDSRGQPRRRRVGTAMADPTPIPDALVALNSAPAETCRELVALADEAVCVASAYRELVESPDKELDLLLREASESTHLRRSPPQRVARVAYRWRGFPVLGRRPKSPQQNDVDRPLVPLASGGWLMRSRSSSCARSK